VWIGQDVGGHGCIGREEMRCQERKRQERKREREQGRAQDMASESADACFFCTSGVLRFQRTDGDPKFETKKLKKGVEIVYASTGITASTTKVVGDVKAKKEADEKWFEELIGEYKDIVESAEAAVDEADWGKVMRT
jgi:mevalonate kinase